MEKLTLNIDLKTCELLDKILQAFGDGQHLDKDTVLEILENDENSAVKYINILAQLKYIRKIAEIEGSRLGMMFYKEENSDLFLAQGGFVAKFTKAAEEKKIADNRQNISDENARLENENLKYQATIRDQEIRIRNLDEKLKKFEVLKNYEWLIRLMIGVTAALVTWWFTEKV